MTSPAPAATTARELLRHALATIAYRGGKALRGAPAEFAHFKAAEKTRTPVQILAHVGDLFDWAVWLAKGEHKWNQAEPQPWEQEVGRFFAALQTFDKLLASSHPLAASPEKLFQGPVADALTHVGQLAMLRSMAGFPVRGENFFKAEIVSGKLNSDQAAS